MCYRCSRFIPGAGRRRGIVGRGASQRAPVLRVRILLYERTGSVPDYELDLRHRLEEDGHDAAFAAKALYDLGMDARRVARFVARSEADAWIVCGASIEVLEWFVEQPVPAFALFGRMSGLRIAGAAARKIPAMVESLRRLVELGHRRIVMLVREERLRPQPAVYEQAFLDELGALGIEAGSYNLPLWGNSPEGLHRCLDSLFRHTPPSALIISEPKLFIAAREHLAQRGIVAPRDVSMICDDPDIAFSWCDPSVAHYAWGFAPLARRIQRWVDNVARGRDDRQQSFTKAEFIEGGTIGPVPCE
jgi:DNA-binding LacI/PurR family transcriptional regulator